MSRLYSPSMQLAFIDEAGTSAKETHAVVAAVIIDPDNDFQRVESAIAECVRANIPDHLAAHFHFHAKDVWGRLKTSEGWSSEVCNQIVDAWLRIPQRLNLPVILAWLPKNMEDGRCQIPEVVHAFVFGQCIAMLDRHMQAYAPGQAAMMVVEDCPPMRRRLNRMVEKLQNGELANHFAFQTVVQQVRGGPLFAPKLEAPFLQLADAHAYAFRRYAPLGGHERRRRTNL